ncbi:MAG TPA: hypothetical protein VIU38_13545 [Anaerolineales bacterium]
MSSAMDVLKKQLILVLLVLAVGVAIGVPLGWATVRVVNTTPAVLRDDLQEDYLRMAIDSFRVNRDPNLAVNRWDSLGPAAGPAFVKIQKDPRGIDPVVIVAFGEVIQAVKGTRPEQAAPASSETKRPSSTSLLIAAMAVLVLVAAATALFFVRRMMQRRASVSISPTFEQPETPREPVRSRKTNFESLGVAPPITQNMTTYVLGDDLYDESFSIDTPSGDFLGEYGVGVSETIGIGEPKKVTALEIWLFDKNDIKTATKVLMSAHAFADAGTRSRLEAKGELIQVEPQKQLMLETETLQLLATVVDLQYGDGTMPESSYFERVTLELAIWRKAGH